MNKYLVLFISFIGSLLLVVYEDNDNISRNFSKESVYVFNEIDETSIVVDNPDTSDINIYVYFIILFYSLLFILVTIDNIKKINKYVNVMKL